MSTSRAKTSKKKFGDPIWAKTSQNQVQSKI